ncbi:RNA polymerase factor sigma-54 [Thiothrix subterranea]|uniref:RNA polymerase sigma-54 factor n=2 Tax=Thiothrix subterranea TaxID=2735563 RepID=A0AA51MR14_9GAMM|nr:RNA polymerase factor sigma-54 [Thiothrix subterranea]MDQ5767430.1 RNA polymerase factor sigma-54 [Thiothrix subterranea]WML88698.1 RNA polymerase factor sigma-54 [Thiothrix subterranea]
MLRQGFDLKLGQTLSMTPQLQQAIRLLQLSSLELQNEIQQALEENPLLQLAEDTDDSRPEPEIELAPPADSSSDSKPDNTTTVDAPDDASPFDQDIPDELHMDAEWEDVYDTRSSNSDGAGDNSGFLENQGDTADSGLQEHLLWQIRMSNLTSIDKQIATVIISSLDDAGYLCDPLEDILESFDQDLLIDLDDIEVVLKFIQQLDPLGVGARNLRECLLIQLAHLPESRLLFKARHLVEKHLDLMERRDYKEISKRLKIEQGELEEILLLLRSLQPRPGSAYSATAADYIVPDAYVRKIKGDWVVSLNAQVTPNLQVNQYYADMLGQVKNERDSTYFKSNLQQARWLIRSVESRNSTLLGVAKAIVERQSAFMQYGEQAMKPLILRDIAEELEMHESTISRVTTNKYLYTPRGIFEFKYFFSSQVDTDTGSSCSSTAIRAMLKKLINEENQGSPLSDNQLTALLNQQGINVARRTVAKYREAMSIPSSHDRKALLPT